ncbi:MULTISPECIES: ABC transporter permease [Bacillus cereus group]|uniref:ABC transporter permease n=1 Tax=Bacillus cereus group TaxID=86661 RepID=UPI001F562556|nr:MULTISPECIES: ABC transporter permease [Bacillus cereus group]MDH2889025.1 ABC transporter permease [Bacillus cytotoxicus]
MNFIKRAILSMKKRKGTSFILLGVFLIVTNLVLAGFTIQNASKKAAESARKKLGTDVTLSFDYDKAEKARGTGGMPHPPNLNAKLASQLGKSQYVKDYNYTATTLGIPDGFKLVGSLEEQEGPTEKKSIKGDVDWNSSFVIEAIRKISLEESFKNGKSKIIDGKPITEKMIDQNVILMEKRLAEQNKLKIGDKVKIRSGEDKKKSLEAEIIGIYETEKQASIIGGSVSPMMEPANKIYMPHSTLKKLEAGQKASSSVMQAVYYLKDPKDIDAFRQEAKQSDIDFNYFKLDANDALYKKMINPIENISSISQMIIYIVSIASAIILGLIIMLSIKARRKEMGILLSIGEKKWKLIAQFIVEVACVAILAFGLSITTGSKVSQLMGDILLSNEIATASGEEDENDKTIFVGADGSVQETKKADPVDKIDVSVTGEDLGKMGGIGLTIAILATILPALSILRLNPKQILLKDE